MVIEEFINLSTDPVADFSRMAQAYEGVTGRIPANASPIRLLDASVPRSDTIVKKK